jgi:rhodanese-related sulfurtransferase
MMQEDIFKPFFGVRTTDEYKRAHIEAAQEIIHMLLAKSRRFPIINCINGL